MYQELFLYLSPVAPDPWFTLEMSNFPQFPSLSLEQTSYNTGPLVFAKPRRLDLEKLAAAQEEFSAMEKAGII